MQVNPLCNRCGMLKPWYIKRHRRELGLSFQRACCCGGEVCPETTCESGSKVTFSISIDAGRCEGCHDWGGIDPAIVHALGPQCGTYTQKFTGESVPMDGTYTADYVDNIGGECRYRVTLFASDIGVSGDNFTATTADCAADLCTGSFNETASVLWEIRLWRLPNLFEQKCVTRVILDHPVPGLGQGYGFAWFGDVGIGTTVNNQLTSGCPDVQELMPPGYPIYSGGTVTVLGYIPPP